jgi:outer membrane protein TolC
MRQQQRQAELGQRLGSTSANESTAAQILALRSELETLQMRTQLQNARNALEDALHAPLSGPELALSKPLPVAIAGTKP